MADYRFSDMMAQITGPDGQSYNFPDDATDSEILSFFEGGEKLGPKNEPGPTGLRGITDTLRQAGQGAVSLASAAAGPAWEGAKAVGNAITWPGRKMEEATGAGAKLGGLMASGAKKAGDVKALPYRQALQYQLDPTMGPRPTVTEEESAGYAKRLGAAGSFIGEQSVDPLNYAVGAAKPVLQGLRGVMRGVREAKGYENTAGRYKGLLDTKPPEVGQVNIHTGASTGSNPVFSPRPSVDKRATEMPTSADILRGRLGKADELKSAGPAGVARRAGEKTPPAGVAQEVPELPNAIQGGTARIQYPSIQLMKQLGLPLAGGAAVSLPFSEGRPRRKQDPPRRP
jgi:hypothetical protein